MLLYTIAKPRYFFRLLLHINKFFIIFCFHFHIRSCFKITINYNKIKSHMAAKHKIEYIVETESEFRLRKSGFLNRMSLHAFFNDFSVAEVAQFSCSEFFFRIK